MVTCIDCGCASPSGKGWFGYISDEREDRKAPLIALYCPPCAVTALGATPREPYT